MRVITACALLFTSWLLSLDSLKAEVLDVTCYTGLGQNYRGTVATTTSGRTCQSWSVQTPHRHGFTTENFPCSGLENNNYCRNPGGDRKPWCWTTDPQKGWEFCEIPRCVGVGVPEPIVPELSCFTLCGQNYRGTVAMTTSGRTCQSWSVQTPHRHTRTPENFPHAGLENNNYCRNPDGNRKPWCFTTDPLKRWEYCAPRCVPVLDVTCYTGLGQNYRGTVATTTSGRTCQSWSVQTPHSHRFTTENYPCSGLENNNYCRNPGGDRKPWCWTTDPQKGWEFCEIPRCVGVPEPIVPELSCFTLCGQNYRGTVATTTSGRNCQSWSVQTPHRHTPTPENFPHAGLENNNYCRNHGTDGSMKPWCYTTDPQKRWEYCEIPRCVPVLDVTCYTGLGQNYRGTVATTTSGRTCQSWSVQTPHSHRFTTENYPCSGLENNNYCRNHGAEGSMKLWCYTTDPQKLWEYCEIPICVGVPEPIVPELSCFTLCGQNYRGTVATTTSGRNCQSWSVQTPHNHTRTTQKYPYAGLENNNYCRNPDGNRKPWCFTTDPQQRLEFCEIPRCVPVSLGLPQTSPTLLIPVIPVLHTSGQPTDTLLNDGPKNVLLAVDPPGDVIKGSSVTLTCSASGSHPPIQSYILFKDNTAVAQKNTMSISNVQPSHSGTYHCEAWNDIAGVDSPPLTVDVHYPPEIPSVSVSPPGGVVEGSTVTLSCSSDANPPVSRYTWYKDRRSISTGPQLVKNNVSPGDSGRYICLVKNTHGSQRSSAHSLDVQRM